MEQHWNNLKKLLLKRRVRLKEIDVSGTAACTVVKARESLEELQYLSWLFLFVKVRSTRSNLSTLREGIEDGFCKGVSIFWWERLGDKLF